MMMKGEVMNGSAVHPKSEESEQPAGVSFTRSIPSVSPSEVTISRPTPIDRFFQRKDEQLKHKQSNFGKVLQGKEFQELASDHSKSISKFSRFSKSSIRKEEDQLRGVIEEHKKMLGKLQEKMKSEQQLNDFEKNLLKEQKNRYLLKVEELQAQIQQLYRDNYRLKEQERTKPPTDSFHLGNLNQKSKQSSHYKPYVIATRNNDLNRINARNYHRSKEKEREDVLGSKLEKEKPISAGEFFNKRPNNFGLYEEKFPQKDAVPEENNYILKDLLGSSFEHGRPTQKGAERGQGKANNSFAWESNMSMESRGRGAHFDTFQLANTLSFVQEGAINESRQIVRMSNEVSTRNKVAFFKNSLVLLRQSDLEIAFKRSDMNQQMNKLRIIFYLNNKTSSSKTISFDYEYQPEYFTITVNEKLTSIAPHTQGRQVIEVCLIGKVDLNAVTDLHVSVGDKVYDFWLPATFIRFKQTDRHRLQGNQEEMSVLPDRQFVSLARMSEVAPVMAGGRDSEEEWGYLFGESAFGNFTVKLTWRGREVVIQGTQKWIYFIGFILHFFK